MLRKCTVCATEALTEEDLGIFVKQARGRHGYRNLCKQCQSDTTYRKDPLKSLDNSLRSKYGITIDDYNNMFAIQEGCCAICGVHQTQLDKRLSVDHDHSTGKVRQLLCQPCNLLIGFANDNIEILSEAISYINRHKE